MVPTWRRALASVQSTTTTTVVQTPAPTITLGHVVGLDPIQVTGDLSSTLRIGFTGALNGLVTVSDTEPPDPAHGRVWVDTTDGTLYIRYNDGSSSQWVAFGTAGGGGDAANITYDNTVSGLTADDVQAALDELAAGGGATGDVVGPASSVANHVALFDGTTGKLLKDSGLTLSGTNTGDQTSVSGNAGTATALQTARTIDGVSFNGTANITVIAPATHAASSKTTPVDADELPLVDSAASNVLAKLTWANLKAGVFSAWGVLINAATGKTTPVDADAFGIMDSAASNATKKLTFGNLKAALKTYFDPFYASSTLAPFDAHLQAFKHDDFEDFSSSSWTTSVASGSVGQYTTTIFAGHPGAVFMSSGGTTTGAAAILDSGTKWLVLGGGAFWVEFSFLLPTLSNGTDRFSINLGLRDLGAASPTDQLCLRYSDDVNSGNWVLRSIVGGVTTDVNGSTGPVANTWYRARIEVNAAGTSAQLFIDGTSIGTTSAVPTATLRRVAVVAKSVGTGSRLLVVDYSTYNYSLTTPR